MSKSISALKLFVLSSPENARILLSAHYSESTENTPSISLMLVDLLGRLLSDCEITQQFKISCISDIFEILSLMFGIQDEQLVKSKNELNWYILSVNMMDSLSKLLMVVYDPQSSSITLRFIENAIQFLKLLSSFIAKKKIEEHSENVTLSIQTLQSTDFIAAIVIGAVSLTVSEKKNESADKKNLVLVSLDALKSLNNAASVDMTNFQKIVGADGIQTAFFHLMSFWLKYWIQWKNVADSTLNNHPENDLLHELLLLIGYSALNNEQNRSMLRFGSGSSMMLMLVRNLPFEYFCDPEYF